MWIIDPRKQYADGHYHVDFGAAAMVILGLLRWRWISQNFQVVKVRDRSTWLPDVTRYQIDVDFEKARTVANEQAWDYVIKFYGWMDGKGQKGEQVIAELINLGRRADAFRRVYEEASRSAMQASNASLNASLQAGDRTIFGLEMTLAASKATLGVGATLAGGGVVVAATVGKAAVSATELKTKGASIVCTTLNVGADLMIDFGKQANGVGEGFAVVAKGVNKGVGAYMSGKDLSDAFVDGLVEAAFQAGGAMAKASPGALSKLLNAQRGRWMIPLQPLSAPPKGPLTALTRMGPEGNGKLGALLKAGVKDGGKLVKDTVQANDKLGKSLASGLNVHPDRLLVADAGIYETMVRRAVYRL